MRCYDNCPKVQSWQDEAVRFLATEEGEYWCKILQTTLVATRAVGTLGDDKQRSEPSCQSYLHLLVTLCCMCYGSYQIYTVQVKLRGCLV